ncbi:MAG: patatin-like phospholipase family protein [bacterium]|nr:patatin-like phospholipase family protein [bacterium]
MRNVLTLNAGALKTVSQVAVLEELERQVGKATWEIFDVISGTSAGGINAAMLASGYRASELADLYMDPANRIFRWRWRIWRSLFKRKPFVRTIEKYLPRRRTLDDTKVPVILFAQNIGDGINYAFSSMDARPISIARAILRTTSVPPFLEPEEGVWLDPGMGSLFNPTEATLRFLKGRRVDLQSLRVVNLESPLDPHRSSGDRLQRGGLMVRVNHAVETVFADLSRRAHAGIHYYFPGVDYLSCSFSNNRYFDPFKFKDLAGLYEEARQAAPDQVSNIRRFLEV